VWLREVERLPVSILRSIEGRKGLFEIKIDLGSNTFRIFCCFDKGNLVILFNGFQKKTQKTPVNELDKAERLMKEYFNEK
jgi:phage-related protein